MANLPSGDRLSVADSGCQGLSNVVDSSGMREIVVPNEMAKQLGITGLKFRNWLRARAAEGHPLLGGHQHGSRWGFTRAEADQLMGEYAGDRTPVLSPSGSDRARAMRAPKPEGSGASRIRPHVRGPGHRVVEDWMGEPCETLGDLLRPELKGVVVGINPSPVSVAAGHYYQGVVGQRFFRRLEQAGVVPEGPGFEDDRAFGAGLGFTDVVKRPTPRADGLRIGELEHGRALLETKLGDLEVPRIIFTFKKSAVALLGQFEGFGERPGRPLAGASVFVMPGPMEATERVRPALESLRRWWSDPA